MILTHLNHIVGYTMYGMMTHTITTIHGLLYIYICFHTHMYIYTHNQYSPLSLSEGIVPTIPKILSIYTPVPFFIIIFHLPIKMVVSE